MNDIVFFALILLTLTRLLGLGLSVDLFLLMKIRRFYYLVIGWGFWVLAGIIPIVADIYTEGGTYDFLILLNAIFALEGLLLLLLGFVAYYRELPTKIVTILSFSVLIVPISFSIVLDTNFITQNIVAPSIIVTYLLVFLGAIYERSRLRAIVGRGIKWFYATSVIGTLFAIFLIFLQLASPTSGNEYGLYNSTDIIAIIINYSFGVFASFAITILLLVYENGIISKQSNILKDSYSHSLGNQTQIIMGCTDIIHLQYPENKELNEIVNMIKEKAEEAGELIMKVRNL